MGAAVQDKYADASVGNVTGSNSVNVFLGLGLPWMIGAIYWNSNGATSEWLEAYPELSKTYPDGGFIVKSGDLGFSVIVFSSVACVCLALLAFRRKAYGGELGGAPGPAKASSAFLVFLWLVYVSLSSWKAMQNVDK